MGGGGRKRVTMGDWPCGEATDTGNTVFASTFFLVRPGTHSTSHISKTQFVHLLRIRSVQAAGNSALSGTVCLFCVLLMTISFLSQLTPFTHKLKRYCTQKQ